MAFMRKAAGLCLALPLFLAHASCNTTGLRRVYISPDQGGERDTRQQYHQGDEIFCVAEYASGRKNATIRIFFQPVEVPPKNPLNPKAFPPVLVAEGATDQSESASTSAQFPVPTIQVRYDTSGKALPLEESPAQTPGKYQCVVELEGETQVAQFVIAQGADQSPTNPGAPPIGACNKDTLEACPDPSPPDPNIIKCCNLSGTCGHGPIGTGFCYNP